MSEAEKVATLQNYRLAFRADTLVNWCPGLGTVLANDEVKDGLSVRGGFPVEQKQMKQRLRALGESPTGKMVQEMVEYVENMMAIAVGLIAVYS